MSVRTDTPHIYALIVRVEEKAGFSCNVPGDFLKLSIRIYDECSEMLSESTLQRVWGYSTRSVSAVSRHTLDVLASYIGEKDWDNFLSYLKINGKKESEFYSEKSIFSSSLKVGSRLRLGWSPDRIAEVCYDGDNRYHIVSAENTALQPGDSFSCIQFQKGRPFYLDRFCNADGSVVDGRYAVGELSGLTVLELL